VPGSLSNALYIIPILAVLILVHEFGHYLAARRCGVKVEEFGIGIPPRIYGKERNGMIWSINAIPFGGFVRVKGEDAGDMSPDSMNSKPPLQRAFFLTAGVMMNLLLAVVLMIAVVGFQGVPHSSVYIAAQGVQPGSPAYQAGWQPGDRIVAVDGDTIETVDELASRTRSNAGNEITVTVERAGNEIETSLTPRKDPPEGQGPVGVSLVDPTNGKITTEQVAAGSAAAEAGIQPGDVISEINGRTVTDAFVLGIELQRFEGFGVPIIVDRGDQRLSTTLNVPQINEGDDPLMVAGLDVVKFKPVYEKVPVLEVIPRGFQEAYHTTTQMLSGLKSLFTSTENLKQVSGPIGMGQATGEIISESTLPLWVTLSQITIVLSLNLALLNMLPFPALDGGRLVFVIIEMLRGGRKIAPEKEGLVHFAGIVLLLGVMFVVAFSDIQRIVDGRSFIP
jgi:regulator of sigma E protease